MKKLMLPVVLLFVSINLFAQSSEKDVKELATEYGYITT